MNTEHFLYQAKEISKNSYRLLKKSLGEIRDSGLLLFFKQILRQPRTIGAAMPSSPSLAQAMVRQIPPNEEGLIIELGAGTGVITQELLKQGFPAENLRIVEQSSELAEFLKSRFPELSIIQSDATRLLEHSDIGIQSARVMISSLPLRSLPKEVVQALGHVIQNTLQSNGIFIQFTYGLRKGSPYLPKSLCWQKSQWVWSNFPPARVDVFYYQPE